MKKSPHVFVVVFNIGNKYRLVSSLDSIYSCEYKNLEVIVIDNASDDGSLEAAKKRFPKFNYMRNSSKMPFATSCNLGIRFALEKMADYVMIMTGDMVMGKGSLQELLLESEKNDEVGIASPVIFSEKTGLLFFAGGKIDRWDMSALNISENPPHQTQKTFFCSEHASLIKKALFKKVGLLDERIVSARFSLADLSARAIRHGFSLLIVPGASSYRQGGYESGGLKNDREEFLSSMIFFENNYFGLAWVIVKIRFFSKKMGLAFSRVFEKQKNRQSLPINSFPEHKNLIKPE